MIDYILLAYHELYYIPNYTPNFVTNLFKTQPQHQSLQNFLLCKFKDMKMSLPMMGIFNTCQISVDKWYIATSQDLFFQVPYSKCNISNVPRVDTLSQEIILWPI